MRNSVYKINNYKLIFERKCKINGHLWQDKDIK